MALGYGVDRTAQCSNCGKPLPSVTRKYCRKWEEKIASEEPITLEVGDSITSIDEEISITLGKQ